ncbi:alpha/beta-hydrolase [Hymenopellis radicata]|nr:alpha/beta-hydrolase [Hymenopellis radicata]
MATDTPVLDDKARYEQIKKELSQAIPKKRAVDKQLAALESEIFKLEQQYLQDTMSHSGGNIVHGFENFLKNQSTARRKYEVPEHDRIFSNSSVTIQKSLEINGDGDDADDGKSSSGPTTVTLRPTTSHENKLIRDREYSRRRRNKERASVGTDGDEETTASSVDAYPRLAQQSADAAPTASSSTWIVTQMPPWYRLHQVILSEPVRAYCRLPGIHNFWIRPSPPVVKLDHALVTGTTDGVVDEFLGIPFAKPPTGNRRLQLPEAVDDYTGNLNASAFGPACPQQSGSLPSTDGLPAEVVAALRFFDRPIPSDEDCLTVNVVKPSGIAAFSELPVVVWIYGGGFEVGGTSGYDGYVIVNRSIALEEPIIYVSMNYRLSAFGFLASKEVKEAGIGNLGLQDQRLALRWVHRYIGAFGGNPAKVTIWGESAGAISVASHMLANDGDAQGLFRAAYMQSGSPLHVSPIEHGQPYYDDIVHRTGCAGSSDTLACIRTVPYAVLKAAADASPYLFGYQPLHLAWMPRPDGVFLTDTLPRLLQQGKVANIPVVSGDCDDEGTVFALSQRNITTDAEVKEYLQTVMFPSMAEDDIDTLLDVYPASVEAGSPFDTGSANAITPQFKRLAAFQGDLVFHGPRRVFLSALSGKQDLYSFIYKRRKHFPVLGSYHTSDLSNIYAPGGDMQDYLIRFVATLNPNGNGNTGIDWPKWTTDSPQV